MEEEHASEQPIYNLPSMQMTEGMMKFQLEVEEIINSVENHLLGRVPELDKETNTIEYKYYEKNRLINQKGMNYLSNELRLRLTKIFKLSHFKELQAEKMQLNFGKSLRDAIFQHWDDWEIKSAADASSILHAIVDPYIATLNAAIDGKFLNYLKYTSGYAESQMIRQEPERDENSGPMRSLLQNVFGKR